VKAFFDDFLTTLLVFDDDSLEDFLLFLLSGLETNILRFGADFCNGIFLIVSAVDISKDFF
jgi:hypothetical protein